MICCKCGYDNVEKSHRADPWCMYQVKDGKVVNDLFLPDRIPEGWYDSPKAAKAAIDSMSVLGLSKKIDGRTKQAKQAKALLNDDCSGSDQQVG